MAQEIARVARRLEEAKETKHLDLSKCALNQVPDATYIMLKNVTVESCDLSGNNIKRLQPKFCAKLATLKDIQLENNKLTMLPDDLKNLEDLQEFDISGNIFDSFPTCLYECSKLKKIVAKNNKITDIDVDRLRKMSSLQEVDLKDNPLSQDTLDKLTGLDLLTIHTGQSDPLGDQLDELE